MELQPKQQQKDKTKQNKTKQKDDNNLQINLQEDIYYICFKKTLVLTKKQLFVREGYLQ